MSPQQLWDQVLERLQTQLSRPTFETWIKTATVEERQGNCLQIQTPNPFARKWLEKYYAQAIATALEDVVGEPMELEFTVANVTEGEPDSAASTLWTAADRLEAEPAAPDDRSAPTSRTPQPPTPESAPPDPAEATPNLTASNAPPPEASPGRNWGNRSPQRRGRPLLQQRSRSGLPHRGRSQLRDYPRIEPELHGGQGELAEPDQRRVASRSQCRDRSGPGGRNAKTDRPIGPRGQTPKRTQPQIPVLPLRGRGDQPHGPRRCPCRRRIPRSGI
ncbi:MAG: DnaA N-terminal domain-containing protein [Prochlorothrix sp.]